MIKKQKQEFFDRLFETEPVQLICGSNFNSVPITKYSKPMALNLFPLILRPNFNQHLRESFLKATGELCCKLFLEHSNIEPTSDIHTFGLRLERHYKGRRSLRCKGNLIVDETQQLDGRCACTIVREVVREPLTAFPASARFYPCGSVVSDSFSFDSRLFSWEMGPG